MKGQITIYLFMALIMDLIILAALAPLFSSITNLLLTSLPSDVVSQLLARLIMPILVFSMIFGILEYKDPMRQQ
jgi:hypothetical protein